jgi:hypothetical protein
VEERDDGSLKLLGDNRRVRWYPASLFDLGGGPAPTLLRWWFEHGELAPPELEGCEDVEFEMSDGTTRWCSFATPAHLRTLVESLHSSAEPGVWSPTLVVVKSLERSVVDAMLRHLDQQGELLKASRPIGADEVTNVADRDREKGIGEATGES